MLLADSNSALYNSAILLDDSKICTGNRTDIPGDLYRNAGNKEP